MTAAPSETIAAEPAAPPAPPGPAEVQALDRALAIRRHKIVLVGSIVLLLLSALLGHGTHGMVSLPGVGPMPTLCMWKIATGVDCPGCGLTRCFVALAHGDLADAWRFHPVGIVLFVLLALQIPYRAIQLRRLAAGRPPLAGPWLTAIPWFLVAAMLIQWLVKLMLGIWTM